MGDIVSIFMPLLNEGTDVWRPVEAEHIVDDSYLIIHDPPHGEDWAFLKGTVVKCVPRRFADGQERIVAVEGLWRNLEVTFLEYLGRRAATEKDVKALLERSDLSTLDVKSATNLTQDLKASGADFDHIDEMWRHFREYARTMLRGSQPRHLKIRQIP